MNSSEKGEQLLNVLLCSGEVVAATAPQTWRNKMSRLLAFSLKNPEPQQGAIGFSCGSLIRIGQIAVVLPMRRLQDST